MIVRVSSITIVALLCVLAEVSFANQQMLSKESGLQYQALKTGSGRLAKDGDIVTVNIVGWLEDHGRKGRKFFSSFERGKPVSFVLGTEKVMEGWNEGVRGMRAGGKRRIVVPPHLGYGSKGVVDMVPPNAGMIFDIELLEVR